MLMSKQNPIRPHAARKIRDFSDRLLGAGFTQLSRAAAIDVRRVAGGVAPR